jgi:hypothetical protein
VVENREKRNTPKRALAVGFELDKNVFRATFE